jgi:hypothetical protein
MKLRIVAAVQTPPGFMEDDAIILNYVGKGLNDEMLFENIVQQTASYKIAQYVIKRLKELEASLGKDELWARHERLRSQR